MQYRYVQVGIKVGASGVSITQDSAAVESQSSSSVDFSVELSPAVWHQMSLGVYRRHVTLHVDCDVTMSSPWRRHVANGNGDDDDDGQVGASIVLSVGKAFIESSRYPTFEVSLPISHIITGRQRSCKPCTSYDRDVCLSVCLSVHHTLVLSENDAS